MSQPDLFPPPASRRKRPSRAAAEAARDAGIERVSASAERAHGEWLDKAAGMIADFAREWGAPFLIEDVLEYAFARGLPTPPDGRAWGGAAARARSLGRIVACGYAAAKTSNMSPKVLWRVAP